MGRAWLTRKKSAHRNSHDRDPNNPVRYPTEPLPRKAQQFHCQVHLKRQTGLAALGHRHPCRSSGRSEAFGKLLLVSQRQLTPCNHPQIVRRRFEGRPPYMCAHQTLTLNQELDQVESLRRTPHVKFAVFDTQWSAGLKRMDPIYRIRCLDHRAVWKRINQEPTTQTRLLENAKPIKRLLVGCKRRWVAHRERQVPVVSQKSFTTRPKNLMKPRFKRQLGIRDVQPRERDFSRLSLLQCLVFHDSRRHVRRHQGHPKQRQAHLQRVTLLPHRQQLHRPTVLPALHLRTPERQLRQHLRPRQQNSRGDPPRYRFEAAPLC